MIHRGLSLSDMKCQQFLECGVFLLVNCLSACFVRIAALSVESRCHIKPAGGTGNFDIIIISSGNRHKFTSMFNCASLPLSGICTSTNRTAILTNIGKTVLITKRKPRILELWYFVAKENPLRINVILLWQLFSIPHSQLPGIFMEEIE